MREYRRINKERIAQKSIEWRENNPDYDIKRLSNPINREKSRQWCRNYHAKVKDSPEFKAKKIKAAREWERLNKARRNQYLKQKKETDPIFRLKYNTINLIGFSFRANGYSKKSRTCEILGCSYEFFRAYIEQRFLPGMTWENRSAWHLDHIIPVSSAKTEKQLLKLNHYTNFRPLWAKDNLAKADKITEQLSLIVA
jgi:hypothetical protein